MQTIDYRPPCLQKRAPAAEQKAGGLFDGIFSLPQFKLPWAGAGAGRRRDQARPAESEVSVVNLGVTPAQDKVPVHRCGLSHLTCMCCYYLAPQDSGEGGRPPGVPIHLRRQLGARGSAGGEQ